VKRAVASPRPKVRRTLRVLGGRRVTIEGFGPRSAAFMTISGGSDVPVGTWLSPRQLRQLIVTAQKLLK
jgi:hypothetical protein